MKIGLRILAGTLLWTLAALPGTALGEAPRFEITPVVGYRAGGEFDVVDSDTTSQTSIDLDDGATFGLDLGLYRDPGSFYELLYSRQESGLDSPDPSIGSVDVATEYLHFGGTLLFTEEYWFVPWLSLTIGATRLNPDGGYDSETKFSGSLGAGVRLPINDRIAATLGARGYLTFLDADTAIFCTGSGDLNCLVRSSGSTFFQGEAFLGLSVRF